MVVLEVQLERQVPVAVSCPRFHLLPPAPCVGVWPATAEQRLNRRQTFSGYLLATEKSYLLEGSDLAIPFSLLGKLFIKEDGFSL